MTEPDKDITRLIHEWQSGDRAAEQELFEALYRVLHRIAVQCLRSEHDAGSLGPTALVHEAYLRFAASYKIMVNDRAHFLALAARVMRRIIVDRARARKSEKRGGDNQPSELSDWAAASSEDVDQVLAVDQALDRLNQQSPRQARIVELRYFGGFSLEEAAAVLGVSTRTARRDWQVARLRLKLAIDGASGL
jgi:RNA polymerase sigma-70 factor (ECF subfamily)